MLKILKRPSCLAELRINQGENEMKDKIWIPECPLLYYNTRFASAVT